MNLKAFAAALVLGISLSACAVRPTAPPNPAIPFATIPDLPKTLELSPSPCPPEVQDAYLAWGDFTHQEIPYRFIAVIKHGRIARFVLIDSAHQRVWVGLVVGANTLRPFDVLSSEEARAKYVHPCHTLNHTPA